MYTYYIYMYIYIYIYTYIHITLGGPQVSGERKPFWQKLSLQIYAHGLHGCTPNLPTNIVSTNIARLKLSGKFRMDTRIPPLQIKIMLEFNPVKSKMLVGRLGVCRCKCTGCGCSTRKVPLRNMTVFSRQWYH